MAPKTPLLSLTGVSKYFGAVKALDNVDFDVYPDEVVSLVGDNGAGKTTLIKIITGAYVPDSGEIRFEGERVSIRTPRDSRALGIETIYQDLALHDNVDVRGNIFMGREPTRHAVMLDQRRMERESWDVLRRLRITLNSVKTRVSHLSGGQRQAVAIARAIYWDAKIVIMDEPTAALAVQETEKVLKLIRDLKANGVSVIFICHNLQQVLATADRVVVLRRGERAGQARVEETTVNDIVTMMVG